MKFRSAKVRHLLFLLGVCVPTMAGATDRSNEIGVTDVLYLTSSEWKQSPPERKIALSAAFMSIFCTDGRMPPRRLVACLDADGETGPVFQRAMACSALIVRSDLAVGASR
jgi:hypothetical protein